MQPFTNKAAEPEGFPTATATVYAAFAAAAIGTSIYLLQEKHLPLDRI